MSVDVYYQYSTTEDLQIHITSYEIGDGRTVHDIQIMLHYRLIRHSSGLCVTANRSCDLENSVRGSKRRTFTATPAAYLCSTYLQKAYKKLKKLVLPVSSTSVSHAKAACIKDLRISNNKAFATSAIIFLFRDGLYRKTINNRLYRKQTAHILQAIEQATTSAHREAMRLITNSTMCLA
ncbi:unnamed protein product [Rotaria sp. Silwood1]|nr:unnamed protein product [Rotaria sp. Silwood1]CAF4704622.1 unnamed protein product [Rotaria sp. Silwood1]CAF4818941.1 unnamed protein product [Rotaria sp. Silwood1]